MKLKCFIAALLGAVMIGAVVFLSVNANKDQDYLMKKYAELQLQDATEQVSSKLTMHLASNLNVIKSLSDMIAKEKDDDWNKSNLNVVLKKISDEMQFTNINICNKKGTGFDLEGKEQKVAFCSYYQLALLGDTTVEFTNFYETNDKIDVVYTVPINREGKIVGVLRISMDSEVVRNLMSMKTFRGIEDVYLLKRNGIILTALTEDSPETDNFLELLETEDSNYTEIEQVVKQGRMILTQAKIGNTNCYLSFKGIKDSNDWGIMIAISTDQLIPLFRDKQMMANNNLDIGLLIAVIIISVLLVIIICVENGRRFHMERLAYYDEITDSINYNRFCKDATVLLHKLAGENYAVVQIAIDRFDYIKEFFGVKEGNRILHYISEVIRENVKSSELFCRLNSDYFILLLKYHNKEELTNRISFLDSRLCSFEGNNMKNDKYEFGLHYGIYCIEENNAAIDLMVGRANHALLLVKNDKKQPFEYYNGEMHNKILDQNEIEEYMFAALEEKEFLVYLQPKFDLHTGLQVGAEALVRWRHPKKGLMYPGYFIGVFEKNGFIVKLDMYILDELCHRLKNWISAGYRPMPLSLNISRLNLFDENFVTNTVSTLERYGIPANLIQLEIAEEVITDNIEILSSLMERLKNYGLLISMDNFGTGTTSMNTLYHVPVDELKLDRKFLLSAEKTDRGKNVIRSVIEMAKNLNIKVVSEGVENKAQARMLQELGCDMIQGFVFAEPLPIKEYENYAYGPRRNENVLW